MRVDRQTPEARRSSHKVMACVSDNKAHFVVAREINSGLDVFFSLRADHVLWVVSECAGTGGIGSGKAGVVCPEDPEV